LYSMRTDKVIIKDRNVVAQIKINHLPIWAVKRSLIPSFEFSITTLAG